MRNRATTFSERESRHLLAQQQATFRGRSDTFRWSFRNPIRCLDQAAAIAVLFLRFLRQPSRPIAPRPVANSGNVAGSGVGDVTNSGVPKERYSSPNRWRTAAGNGVVTCATPTATLSKLANTLKWRSTISKSMLVELASSKCSAGLSQASSLLREIVLT